MIGDHDPGDEDAATETERARCDFLGYYQEVLLYGKRVGYVFNTTSESALEMQIHAKSAEWLDEHIRTCPATCPGDPVCPNTARAVEARTERPYVYRGPHGAPRTKTDQSPEHDLRVTLARMRAKAPR